MSLTRRHLAVMIAAGWQQSAAGVWTREGLVTLLRRGTEEKVVIIVDAAHQ